MSHFQKICARITAPTGTPRPLRCRRVSIASAVSIIGCIGLLIPTASHAQVPPPPTVRTMPWQPPTTRAATDFPNDQAKPNASPAMPWEVSPRPTIQSTNLASQSKTNLANLRPPRDIFTQQTPLPHERFAARPLNGARNSPATESGFDLRNAITEKFGSGIQPANLDQPADGRLFDVPRLNRPGQSDEFSTPNPDVAGVTAAASTMATNALDGVQNWVQEQTAAFSDTDSSEQIGWSQRLSSMTGGADIRKIGGSLAMVLGGYLGLVWLLRKINPAGNQSIPSEVLEVVGNAPLDSRQNLQLVRLGSKLLLMIHGPDGTQPIGEVTDPAEVNHLVALCNGKSRKADSAVSQAVNRHQTGGSVSDSLNLSSNQQNNLTQLLSALEHVNRGTPARIFEA